MNNKNKLATVPNLTNRLWGLARHIESPTPVYSGRGEVALAMAVLPLTFLYKVLDCLYGKNAIPGQPWFYILLLSAFTAIAFSSVFWLATRPGAEWISLMLTPAKRILLASLPVLYVGGFILAVWGLGLPEYSTQIVAMRNAPWLTIPYPVFLGLAALLLFGGFWLGIYWAGADKPDRFGLRDLGCVVLAVLPYLVLQEQLPLLWCFTTPIAVVLMVYATGLGREYFCFSFVPRSWRETWYMMLLMAIGVLLFLAVAFFAGSINYTGALWRFNWQQLFDVFFTNLFIVGVSEEILFRSAILTVFMVHTDKLTMWGGNLCKSRLLTVFGVSLLFGIAHFPHGLLFSFLAFWASLLYGLAFVAGKSLFGPVLLHGLLNVLVLMNFHLSDFK